MVTDARLCFSQSPAFSFSDLLTDASWAFLLIFCTVRSGRRNEEPSGLAMGSPTLAASVEREKGLRLVSASLCSSGPLAAWTPPADSAAGCGVRVGTCVHSLRTFGVCVL